MNNKINIFKLFKIIPLLLFLSITGCGAVRAYNLKATDDLGGKKVLAGRLLFYRYDNPYDPLQGMMFFTKAGDKEGKIFTPDKDGYVYVPVTTGRYYFYCVAIETFRFNLDPFASVTVTDNDSAVNFGTFNVKFIQSTAEKVANFLSPVTTAHIKVDHVPDYDITQPTILTKIGKAMHLTDGKVTFLKRVQKTE